MSLFSFVCLFFEVPNLTDVEINKFEKYYTFDILGYFFFHTFYLLFVIYLNYRTFPLKMLSLFHILSLPLPTERNQKTPVTYKTIENKKTQEVA